MTIRLGWGNIRSLRSMIQVARLWLLLDYDGNIGKNWNTLRRLLARKGY
jgi:hypothetical protein